MSQTIFRDPIVTVAPIRTGVGTGSLQIDRLTHFTLAQDYTLTCIAKTPDTLFVVAGNLDGNVGIATVGTQFFDQDLKVFFTLSQGSTAFEIGDQFTFSVGNGTDLNQANIDEYDELPQKNFGVGTRGFVRGDDNIRFSDLAVKAERFIDDLKFIAQTAGSAGDAISIEYAQTVPASTAQAVIQDLTYAAASPGAAGNATTVQYIEWTPGQKARITIQNLQYQAVAEGTGGNSITVAYTTGAVAGAEVVSVVSSAISVQIESGVSTATQIAAAILASVPASALVTTAFKPGPSDASTAQTAPVSPTSLVGGSNSIGAAGFEVVQVVGSVITVTIQGGVSTATQVRTAVLGSGPASALVGVTISGTGSNPQTTFVTPTSLAGGADIKGPAGFEVVEVTGSAIRVFLESGVSIAAQVRTAILAAGPAVALVNVTIAGAGTTTVAAPRAAENLIGGRNKFFSLNHDEQSDSAHFAEGNASVKAKDADLSGHLSVAGHAQLLDTLSLADTNALNKSGATLPNVQRTLNDLLYVALLSEGGDFVAALDGSSVSWSADMKLRVIGSSAVITIAANTLSLADGEVAYIDLDNPLTTSTKTLTVAPLSQANLSRSDRLWIFQRSDTSLYIRNGLDLQKSGSGSGTVRVDLYDPVSTVLPTGASATVDGVAVTNDMLVLFSGLSSGNNRIYKASGVGTSISWVAQSSWSNGLSPALAEDVLVGQGQAFGLQRGIFDGSDFQFNANVRYFNGTDYWEVSSLQTSSLSPSTTADVFSVNVSGSENLIIDFSVLRGARKDTGTLHVAVAGTSVNLSTSGAFVGDTGVGFSAAIVTGVLHVKYTADGSSGSPTMKYYVRRWSDGAGGPAGVPSYSGAGGTGIIAAGTNTQIQFNNGGNLGADAQFTWDSSIKALGLNGLEVGALSSPVVLADNTMSPADAIVYNATNYPFVILEYSIQRDLVRECGRLIVATNGIDVTLTADFAAAGGSSGIVLTAVIDSGNVKIQYVSTSTGLSGSLKYSFRRWA